MPKFKLSQEQVDALLRYINDPKREIHLARYRLDGLADLVEKEKLPKAFLAFEILNQLTLAQEEGFSSDEYLGVVPECLASETVDVPVQVLNILINCYHHFIYSDPTKASLEKSFGFAAPKQRSRPISHKLEKLQDDRYCASEVLKARIENFSKAHIFLWQRHSRILLPMRKFHMRQ